VSDHVELEAHFYLGSDSDCETCGSSWNELEYLFIPMTGEHRLNVRVGCYGGESLTTRIPSEAVEFAERYVGDFPDAAESLKPLCEAIQALAKGEGA
jgi:hypothetical protein